MRKTIFAYEEMPVLGRLTSDLGKRISVYDNGEVTSAVVQTDNKIISEDVVSRIPGLVLEINEILDAHKSELEDLPSEIRNGTLDGVANRFTFQEIIISGYNLNYCNAVDFKGDSRYKDAALCTNKVLDIFNEIVILMNRYCIRHELLRVREHPHL